ncbi:Glutathione S-transferase [Gemmobacter megaterium]|uniref:Glutathione S-transferase n=1 Tax=Gemmobacter megaterium TaxID=1086013 RepID=A0A1N7P978_9RHOB|nr:glutathione S-transferase [Gemmobacter megaterium]GGE19705.1 glutathione S-transferase [Gemmobacter megaterium]SIT07131.1 Glutathione S-transferase [Gemmobacter megaterium]
MRLFHSPTSPFVRKVMIVLHETALLPKVELTGASGTPIEPGTMPLAQNPLGKVPALEREDGPAIYDSRVICRYLDELAGGKMYPTGPALWDALTLEATADGMMDAAVLMVYESKVRPEDKRVPDWVEGQWSKVARSLDALETRWIAHLAGPFDIGQASIICALDYLDLRHADRTWRAERPALAAFHARVSERPSLKTTLPPQG